MSLTSKDIDLIVTFSKCLGLLNKIGTKQSGYGGVGPYYHLQFGSVLFYRWLLSIGLTPNKTHTVDKLNIPDSLFFDFLRGSFDGDGCIYSYWDKRWHSSYCIYMQFTCASKSHLFWLNTTIEKLTGFSGSVKNGTRVYNLCYAKKASTYLYKKMFYRENIPCLERKRQKLCRIFDTEAAHSLGDARVL